ncbi:MAG: cytochrome c-type biogenesis protein CcmH [Actinomycetota bacterium]
MRRASALILALAATLALAVSSTPAQERASLTDIEDEVMCPICGTLLELSEAPQAARERVFIRRLIAEGRTKEQIKDALVADYGSEVLASPEGSGFDLAAYLVPIAAFIVAAAAVLVAVTRWRRRTTPAAADAAAPSGEDAERLESDLARYDL